LSPHADFDTGTFELDDEFRVNDEAGIEASAVATGKSFIEQTGERGAVISITGG
jgi:hypothetical protein